MRNYKAFLVTLLILPFLLISCNEKQELFKEGSSDWYSYGEAKWYFSNKELISTIKNREGYLLTKQVYEDFVLEMEFKPDSTINTGVFIRCKNNDLNPTNCYEVNIWDLHPDKDNSTGSIVTRVAPLEFVETINKWNTLKVRAKKNKIQVWINNRLTVDMVDDNLPEGHIGLQSKGTGEIRFRNSTIKILK